MLANPAACIQLKLKMKVAIEGVQVKDSEDLSVFWDRSDKQ